MKIQILLFIILAMSLDSFGQEEMNSGIIYGKNYAFMLTAPPGWVLDNQSGASQGLNAVFYKKGESWKDAINVMYTNSASLEIKGQETLERLIEYDLNGFKKDYPGIKITEGKDIIINENVKAKIRYLSGGSYKNFEAVAYIDAVKNAIMIVLSCRNKEGFDDSQAAFEKLVKSYFHVSDKVKFEKTKK